MNSENTIEQNLKTINEKISQAEIKSGRKNGSVKLLAVSKFHPQEAVLQAINGGQLLFGENRVQEAFQKFPDILNQNPSVQLHLIGQLQSNKVKKAVSIASCIQSVDRPSLIEEIRRNGMILKHL